MTFKGFKDIIYFVCLILPDSLIAHIYLNTPQTKYSCFLQFLLEEYIDCVINTSRDTKKRKILMIYVVLLLEFFLNHKGITY